MSPPRTVTRSLSLYPKDWALLDATAEKLAEIEGIDVRAPRVVRNLLLYRDQLVKDVEDLGGLVRP